MQDLPPKADQSRLLSKTQKRNNFQKNQMTNDLSNENLSQLIETEKAQFEMKLQDLENQNQELDTELEILSENFLQTKNQQEKVLVSLRNNYEALVSNSNSFNNSISKFDFEIRDIQSQIDQLTITSNTVENSLNRIQNDIQEINQMINSIPSNNPDILEIAKRKAYRNIQNQIYKAETDFEDLKSYKSSIQDEIALSQTIIKSISAENDSFKTKIREKQSLLDHFQKQNALYSKRLEESRGLIPISSLKSNLKKMISEGKHEIHSIERKYRKMISAINSNNFQLQNELDERCRVIESLNLQYRDLTWKVVKAKDEAREAKKSIQQMNQNEIKDIQERFQMQLEKALEEQRDQILASIRFPDG